MKHTLDEAIQELEAVSDICRRVVRHGGGPGVRARLGSMQEALQVLYAKRERPGDSEKCRALTTGDWWCGFCGEYLSPSRVTSEECCDTCKERVEWMTE